MRWDNQNSGRKNPMIPKTSEIGKHLREDR